MCGRNNQSIVGFKSIAIDIKWHSSPLVALEDLSAITEVVVTRSCKAIRLELNLEIIITGVIHAVFRNKIVYEICNVKQ